ncbi:periplasmic binding protein-like II [Neocallimastix sp. 'constans']
MVQPSEFIRDDFILPEPNNCYREEYTGRKEQSLLSERIDKEIYIGKSKINFVPVKTIIVNIWSSSREINDYSYELFRDEFNKYSEEKKLNITINLTKLTTATVINFGSSVEVLLKRNSSKYDIYFYDYTYVSKYAPYLLELNEYVSKEELSQYNSKILLTNCYHQNKLVGLPIKIGFNVLYSNKALLKKYKKEIPRTWRKLIDTGYYIYEKEKKLNNTDLIPYIGIYNDSEECLCSVNELIYSFRDSPTSPFPDLLSKEATMALETLREIKDKFLTDSIINLDTLKYRDLIIDNKGLFVKFWMFSDDVYEDNYEVSLLPGNKEGVSGSSLIGYNIGINKHISFEKKKGAIEVLKFITSKEFQKKLVLNNTLISAISSIYNDEDVCKKKNCALYNNIQLISKPVNLTVDYDEYDEKFREYISEFFQKGKSVKETLQKIIDIMKIYTITIKTDDTYVGLIIFIFITFYIVFILLSLVFLYKENFSPYFRFLPNKFWIIIIFGIVTVLCSCFTQYGTVTSIKCFLKFLFLAIGSTLVLTPILYKLIIIFPVEFKFFKWIENHKKKYFIFFFLIDIFITLIMYFISYDIEDVIIPYGQNFQICKMKNFGGNFLIFVECLCKILIISVIAVFIYTEWNISYVLYSIRCVMVTLYIDIITVILLFIINIIIIKNYIWYTVIKDLLIIIMTVVNYLLLYGNRILVGLIRKKNIKQLYINKITKNFIENENNSEYDKSKDDDNNDDDDDFYNPESNEHSHGSDINKSVILKIIDFHYLTQSSSSREIRTSSVIYKTNFI